MARGDQQVPDDQTRVVPDTPGQLQAGESRLNLLAAAGDGQSQPRVWAQEVAQVNPGNQGNQWTEIPTVDGHTIRIDPRKNFIEIYGPGNQRPQRQRLEPNQPVRIGNKDVYVNPDGYIDVPTQTGYERQYPGGIRENVVKGADNKFTLAERKYPDGSYERYAANGKLTETYLDKYLTKFDANGRKTEVSTPQGDKYSFKYGADGKVDSYEITKPGADGKPQVAEKATRTDGNLRIERRQPDGTMKVDERLKDRVDVAIRSDLRIDYLDKDGYGLPDATGRSFKRDDRTVMAPARTATGEQVQYPVNPIRSVRMADGRQIDYEYTSDKARAQGQQAGQDGLSSYTIRDRSGKIVEFAQRIPEIPNPDRPNVSGWMEYKAKPGQGLPPDQVANVKRLMAPADASKMTSQQGVDQVKAEMTKNREELFRTRPMVEFMPTQQGKETVSVGLDQVSGKQFNMYKNGETLVRTDKSVVLGRNPDGVNRVEEFQSKRDNSTIDVNYDPTGRVPTEIIITQRNGVSLRMAPDARNPNSWLEYQKGADGNWAPTGQAFPMKVDMVTNQYGALINGKPLAPGSIIITQGDNHRILSPTSEEFVGNQAALKLERRVNQPLPGTQQQLPDWTQGIPRQRQQTPPVRPDRRQQQQQGLPKAKY